MVRTADFNDLYWWKWRFGIPADIWLLREREIGEFIKEYQLEPVSRKNIGYAGETTEVEEGAAAMDIKYILDIRGGRRVPHLHYRGNLYLLNQDAWRDFSGRIVTEFSERLAASQSVPFESFMDLTDTMDRLR